jgi:hypothetical protein
MSATTKVKKYTDGKKDLQSQSISQMHTTPTQAFVDYYRSG